MENNKIFRLVSLPAMLFACAVLTACVTTETGGFSEEYNREEALQASLQLSRQYISERKWDRAKRHLRVAQDIDPRSAEVHEAMALVFQNTGEIDRAEDHYQKAISYQKNFSRARLNYAVFLMRYQRFEDAIPQLDEVVADTLYDRRQLAYLNLGRCYKELGNPKLAEENYRRGFLMSNRQDHRVMLELADVNYILQDYPTAQRYYDGYRKRVQQQSARALLLGVRLARVFNNSDAAASYGLALKNLYPTSQEYLDYRAEVEQ